MEKKVVDSVSINHLEQANGLAIQGNYQEAIKCYLKMMKENPKDSKVLYSLGIAYENTGKNQKALKSFESALKYEPNNIFILFNIILVK